jgi:hypothetical protein
LEQRHEVRKAKRLRKRKREQGLWQKRIL